MQKLFRPLFIVLLILVPAAAAQAQGFRIGDSQSVSSALTTPGVISTVSNSTINVCSSPANAVPCTNKATTYTSVTLGTPCSTSTQVVLAGTSTCVATTDTRGNWGAWVAAGNYDWTVTLSTGQSFGPFSISAGNPSATNLVGPGTVTGNYTHSGTETFKNINGVVYLDGINYTTLATCYAAIPAGGGACVVPPNYTETMGASLTMNKTSSGFIFMGPAAVSMGTNQIIVAAATHGAFFNGTVPLGGGGFSGGAAFTYTGTSVAFQIGGSSATTRDFAWDNIYVSLTGGAGATALSLRNVVYFEVNNPSINGVGTANTLGIVLDGTGNFTGTGHIVNPVIANVGTGIAPGVAGMSATTIIGGTIQTFSTSPSIGIEVSGGENYIHGTDLESNTIALKLDAAATNTYADFRSEANTTDVQAIAGSDHNTVRVRISPSSAAIVKSDAGTNNHISLAVDGDFTTLYYSEGIAPAGVAAKDVCYGDSTAHWPECSANNTAFGKVLLAGNQAGNPIQTKRVAGCATAGALPSTCDTTVTWTNAFADANYTATCTGAAITSGLPEIVGHSISAAKTGAAITVRTTNNSAAAAQFTNIECIAVHD